MAGRGRGNFRRSDEKRPEPLRRPGTKALSSHSSQEEVNIDDKLERLQLADYENQTTPPSVAVLSQNIKDQMKSKSDMQTMARVLIRFGTKGRQQASVAAQLVQELRPFTCDGTKFFVEFLGIFQTDFEGENVSSKPNFLGYVTFLCETYYHAGREGSNPLNFLKIFILDRLQELLASDSDEKISAFVEQVLKLCEDFTEDQWNTIMISVRKCIISSNSPKTRSSLLQLFELYLKNWCALSKDVNQMYNSFQ